MNIRGGRASCAGWGTTLVALLVEAAGRPGPPSVTLAHVGDSRCYAFRDGRLTALTVDHSLVDRTGAERGDNGG